MLSLYKLPDARRYIDDGRVPCARVGRDIEADSCVGCQWLVELQHTGLDAFVRCRAPARRLPDPAG